MRFNNEFYKCSEKKKKRKKKKRTVTHVDVKSLIPFKGR